MQGVRNHVLLRLGGDFFFNKDDEPPHVHVQRDRALANSGRVPVALASSKHFSAHELSTLLRHVMKHRQQMLEAWHDYFSG